MSNPSLSATRTSQHRAGAVLGPSTALSPNDSGKTRRCESIEENSTQLLVPTRGLHDRIHIAGSIVID